jgi:hypothetical protein
MRSPRDAARACEIAQQHIGEQPRVDIAAAQHQTDLAPANSSGCAKQRGEACGARALDHRLFDLEQQADRAFQMTLGDQHDVVVQLGDALARIFAGFLDRDPLGERIALTSHIHAVKLGIHRRIEFGLHPDEADVGIDPRAAVPMPVNSPPPPIGMINVSISGTSSSISSATVPCPAAICGWSNG